eukprot:TRINITY_DN9475_c0_g2_i1.p1 TRINITY_DN9475_c0_g2~~TRINITY_DN9475_c0_g2_i1.p1  ORF type:complete len:127 (-),score=28.17 TRINITY_DN9475_c0_g2_i1:533-913(-)
MRSGSPPEAVVGGAWATWRSVSHSSCCRSTSSVSVHSLSSHTSIPVAEIAIEFTKHSESQMHAAATAVQRIVRGWLARRCYRRLLEEEEGDWILENTWERLRDHAARRLQSAWRTWRLPAPHARRA